MSVISIQSQVSYGYAGNSAAVFPLQLLGFDVWAINTVNFASHTGYGKPVGKVFDGKFILEIAENLKNLGVFSKTKALLSGYLGDLDIADAVFKVAYDLRQANSDLVFFCDPVMGNRKAGFFVKDGIAQIFKEKALTNATIMKPNHFELEVICESKIENLQQAKKALLSLTAKGLKCVVATSMSFADNPDEIMIMLASSDKVYVVTTPRIDTPFKLSGTGDVFAAVFLAHYLKGTELSKALQKTVASVFAVIEKTFAANQSEILLIANQGEIIQPSKTFLIREI
ncbi:MAG: pyridoxal kinase PdxY [Alphaproteobacteria bacterium]